MRLLSRKRARETVNLYRKAVAFVSPRPITLFHKPTARCDCACRHCRSWTARPVGDDTAPLEKILAMLDRARAGGMTDYVVWGGDPLMVKDLPSMLEYAQRLGFETTICTSGYLLAERAAQIGPHLDRLIVSMEGVGNRLEEIRRKPGLFERVRSGIAEFRRYSRGIIRLWCNLGRGNRDQVEPVARFAGEQGGTVEFFPMALVPGYNDGDILDPAGREEVFAEVGRLKRGGGAIANPAHSLELMRTGRPYRCNQVRLGVQVLPDGRIWPCDPGFAGPHSPYGRGDEVDIGRLRLREDYHAMRERFSSCNRCLAPCAANGSDSLGRRGARSLTERLRGRLV